MFYVLFLLFVLIPVVELSVIIEVGNALGSWTTAGLIIFTAVVGVSLVRSQGLATLMQVQQKLAKGEAPGQQIVEGMMLAVAGLMLLIPGFVTDFIGLLLLTPFTRAPMAAVIYKRMQVRAANNPNFHGGGFTQGGFGQGQNPFDSDAFRQSPFGQQDDGNTFDGDFERKTDPDDKRPESHQLVQDDEANVFDGEVDTTPKNDIEPEPVADIEPSKNDSGSTPK
ncbi:FxsA family protein [Shewanella gelidii]|uniref:Membrane protein n=1 Tax=Shewanella gelidii TaxID=1642821 RepID=A0A917JRE6_9GAMM|nr:FxsA family protein [Shewanella gelidii]MCL1097632.1 FxsA family protein [Shewanella gelidii]GGI80065.1 membrane protein [Shewanella gelidii]